MQTSLEMPDGLRPPFYAVLYRFGVPQRWQEDNLRDLLWQCRAGSLDNQHYVAEIGDALGPLWGRPPQGAMPWEYVTSERAPAANYEDLLESDDEW